MEQTNTVQENTTEEKEVKQYLYRWYNTNDDLLYVGITNNPSARSYTHNKESRFFIDDTPVRCALELFGSRDEVLDAERLAIINEKPIYNKVHNTRNPFRAKPIDQDILNTLNEIEAPRIENVKTYTLLDYVAENAKNYEKEEIELVNYGEDVFNWITTKNENRQRNWFEIFRDDSLFNTPLNRLIERSCYLIIRDGLFAELINSDNIFDIMQCGYSVIHGQSRWRYDCKPFLSFIKTHAKIITYEMLFELIKSFNSKRWLDGLARQMFDILAKDREQICREYVKWRGLVFNRGIDYCTHGEEIVYSEIFFDNVLSRGGISNYDGTDLGRIPVNNELWKYITVDSSEEFKKKLLSRINSDFEWRIRHIQPIQIVNNRFVVTL